MVAGEVRLVAVAVVSTGRVLALQRALLAADTTTTTEACAGAI